VKTAKFRRDVVHGMRTTIFSYSASAAHGSNLISGNMETWKRLLTLYTFCAHYYRVTRRTARYKAQNPLHQFPRNFPVDGKAANLMLQTCRLCCGLVTDLLRENWCNGFWA